VASAISDRLTCLMSNGSNSSELGASVVERALMYSELARRETFTKWPHGNYKYVMLLNALSSGVYLCMIHAFALKRNTAVCCVLVHSVECCIDINVGNTFQLFS